MARILVTSALPYINGIKHLGNLVGSMLPADVHARFLRQRGHDVLYICATDEHGTPAELAAHEAELDVAEYCRQEYDNQSRIYQQFNLSFDYFGRSSWPQNGELTQHLCNRLADAGYIEERTIQQVYSVDDERYLPDRYIVGTCPHCGYEAARGDQCENCTRLLDPVDLLDARSAVSGGTNLEVRDTKHLFLLQSKLADTIRAWIEKQTEWPLLVTSIAKKWLDEGLRDRCITRDLSWGIPVDRPGFEGKVFYVWFDAPIAYMSTTQAWSDESPEDRDWKSWWYDAADVRYVQFMAKDNVPFHTVSFPCTLIGSGEPWKLPDYIKGFNWLTFYGGKFSTSQRRGVFTDHALEELPADYWRYWLIANAPESDDTSFTFQLFANGVNKDLADTLGNFVNRCMRFCESKFGAAVPEGGEPGEEERVLCEELATRIASYTQHMEAIQFRKALAELRAIWALGNNYLANAAPWTVIKEDKERAACIVRTGLNLIRLFAVLAWPVIPSTSERILGAFGITEDLPPWPEGSVESELQAIGPNHPFETPGILFKKIEDDQVQGWIEKYGGAPPERDSA